MKDIFGEDVNIILDDYNSRISALIREHPYLEEALLGCVNRTGFLLPYMSAEYAYYSIRGSFIPRRIKGVVRSFGLVGLAVSVDDDIVDEYSGDQLKMISSVSVSELIQNMAYTDLFSFSNLREAEITLSEIRNALRFVVKYQYADSKNVTEGFDFSSYFDATNKTVCPIRYGMRLGIRLAGDERYIPPAEELSGYLGTTLQLLDDLLDLEDDIKNYKHSVTLPMYLIEKGESLSEVFNIIGGLLDKSSEVVEVFPYSEKMASMVAGFKRVAAKVEQKVLAGSVRLEGSLASSPASSST